MFERRDDAGSASQTSAYCIEISISEQLYGRCSAISPRIDFTSFRASINNAVVVGCKQLKLHPYSKSLQRLGLCLSETTFIGQQRKIQGVETVFVRTWIGFTSYFI